MQGYKLLFYMIKKYCYFLVVSQWLKGLVNFE